MEAVVEAGTKTTTEEFLYDELFSQLERFKNKYESYYEPITPMGDKVLIKLFVFKPTEESLGESKIWVKNKHGEWKLSTEARLETVFPICKVISKGEDTPDSIKNGELYVVPRSDVVGDDWNPEFLHLMQNYMQQGKKGSMVKAPEEMPQRIPTIDKNWKSYRFGSPDKIGEQSEEDNMIFLVPPLKLIAEYNI